ncbi:hypothetical protein HU200_058216 [Digitaria exilis]|uniref:NB-ARC domain-containing protein n=1 Tax=Digitaria exilis TaxID=1010633 RepID=A0A835AA28_9POAL|nr:hypothetical protein HU200_058216 [Digitaria exilis]
MLRGHYQLAKKIQELKAHVVEQSESRDRYKIVEALPTFYYGTQVPIDPRVQALFEDAKRLVGIDGPRDKIIQLLTQQDDSHSGLLKIVSIVGFGGLGKTTLSNQVYSKIKNEFQCTAFVSVSRNPDMAKILKDILSRVGYDGVEMEDDVQKLIPVLREQLTNKRYLIIIDDIWSINAWEIMKCIFVENNNGSRVITTTRVQNVATACCCRYQGHIYKMQPLNELQSRNLFFRRVFDTVDGCPQHFKGISDSMLRKCKGVPLAITSIASLLANNSMDVETWERIYNSLGSELDTNPTLEWMRHVLSLSFNDLSHELKTCLLYLGTYPEDHEIHKVELLRKWMAEGFIRENPCLDPEIVAENHFNELINRSMIQPSSNNFDEVWSCRVHDLMLDLIILKCTEENFTTIIDRTFNMNGVSQVRRISHQLSNRGMALAVKTMRLSQVRSYKTFPAADCIPPVSRFEVLRVLDMDRGSFVMPRSICLDLSSINHLCLLKYLKVRGFRLKLPKKFGELKHLMTLDVSFVRLCPSNQSSDLTCLSSLRHLILPSTQDGLVLRNGLSKLCSLRTLFHFDIRTNSSECIRELGELINLHELSVLYSVPRDVEEKFQARMLKYNILAASLDKLGNSNLRSLYCTFVNHATAPKVPFWISCLKRPSHLQRVYLVGLLRRVPNWMKHADRLAYVQELTVQELHGDDIQVLARLPCLVYLRLKAETIPGRNIIFHPNAFYCLKHFEFFCELSRLIFEPTAMQRLQRLNIRFDGRGQGAVEQQDGSPVAGIDHLGSLEEISVVIDVTHGHGSKIESACREAIVRHPRSEALRIHLDYVEYVEDGNCTNTGVQ